MNFVVNLATVMILIVFFELVEKALNLRNRIKKRFKSKGPYILVVTGIVLVIRFGMSFLDKILPISNVTEVITLALIIFFVNNSRSKFLV